MKTKLFLLLIILNINVLAFEIYPSASGKVTILKQIGDSVKKGDILAKIDDSVIELELQYLNELQKIYQQNFNDKELEFKQTNELYEKMVASHRNLELAKLILSKAKIELSAHNVKIKIKQQEIKNYKIISPINSTVQAIPNPRNITNINYPQVLMILK